MVVKDFCASDGAGVKEDFCASDCGKATVERDSRATDITKRRDFIFILLNGLGSSLAYCITGDQADRYIVI
jgi:hypothetical protein